MAKKRIVPEGKTSVMIELDNDLHLAVVTKQIKKFKKSITIAQVCALAVAKGIDKV